jgi:hypothetical protein
MEKVSLISKGHLQQWQQQTRRPEMLLAACRPWDTHTSGIEAGEKNNKKKNIRERGRRRTM